MKCYIYVHYEGQYQDKREHKVKSTKKKTEIIYYILRILPFM